MNKIIESAKEAVEIAKCDHELIPELIPLTTVSKMDRFYCLKCHGTFYRVTPEVKDAISIDHRAN